MDRKYLEKNQLITNLKLGKPVEQWIGTSVEENDVILKWLRIDKEPKGEYCVAYFESLDEGDEDFLDIYEFSKLDPDEPYGIINCFQSYEDALKFAMEEYKCEEIKFLNARLIQDEYLSYLRNKK